MKKGIAFLTAAVLFVMSGCNTDNTEFFDETSSSPMTVTDPSEITTIRWGMESCYGEEGKEPFDALNERLRIEGSNIRIEPVILDHGFDMSVSFADLAEEYEKENGSLDIVTYGGEWAVKFGAQNILIESGYFRELTEEETAFFPDVPKICWEAGKVNGKNYTVPGLVFGLQPYIGSYFCFNTKYIREDKLQSFGSTVSELEDILSEVVPSEDMINLIYDLDYLGFTDFTPESNKGGLFLSEKTMRASNPYETKKVIEYMQSLNELYKKGYMNYEIDFSQWQEDEYIGNEKTEFAVLVKGAKSDESELEERLGKNYQVIDYFLPYYMENSLIASTGIPTASTHPDEAMEILKRLHSDKEFSGLLTPSERDAIGLPADNQPVEVGDNIKLSPFAGFQLKYTDIDFDLQDMLISSFDRLCKAEDFDLTLEEINKELKAAGIDNYVDKVNRLLEECYGASNQ